MHIIQHVLGGPGRFDRQAVDQVGMQGSGRQHARAAAGNAHQVGGADRINLGEGVEYRRHQDRTARMRFEDVDVILRIGREGFPAASLPD